MSSRKQAEESTHEPNAREWELAEEYFPLEPAKHTRAAAMLAHYRRELLEPESAGE